MRGSVHAIVLPFTLGTLTKFTFQSIIIKVPNIKRSKQEVDFMKGQYKSLDRDNKLIWNFRDIGHTMRQISEGRGSQKRILILLRETAGMTQKELTVRLGVQPGSASEVLNKLEQAGLLFRTPSETDHRTTDIRLTPDGEALAKEAAMQRAERHAQMFAVLSDEEKDTLVSLLEKVNAHWDQIYRHPDGE